MARIPNWGPSAGQPVPDEQWQAYMQANPPPQGASFVAGTAAQPQGAERATLGAASSIGPGDKINENPYWRDFYKQQFESTRPGISFGLTNQDQARLEQQRVIQELQRQAAGDMGSLAQQQLAQSYGQARAQQSSLGSTMRGQDAGAAMRGIQQGQAGIQRSLPGEQQMLMLQEQQAAQALLAQMLAQQRGQDVGQAGSMANLALGSQGLDDAMRQFYGGGMLGMDLAATERQNALARSALGFQEQQAALTQGLVNMAAGGAGTAVGVASNFGKPR